MSGVSRTPVELSALLREQLLAALQRGEREIVCSDPDFASWPWNERAVAEALTQWALPSRRLVLLASHYDEVRRRHPRFVAWRITWGHLVDARSPSDTATAPPGLLWAGAAAVEVLEAEAGRARCTDDRAERTRLRHQLDALLQRSEPAFAATTLGL